MVKSSVTTRRFLCIFLVSTYVVCERLSVMHEPAGVVEIWSKSHRIPLFCSNLVQNTPPNENCQRVQIRVSQNTPPKWKLSESPNLSVPEYPPKWKLSESPNPSVPEYPTKMKIVRESKSECPRIPRPNENCQRVQIWVSQNTPSQNENCQRVQIRMSQNPPPQKSEKLQVSNFRIVLQSGRSYVETNL